MQPISTQIPTASVQTQAPASLPPSNVMGLVSGITKALISSGTPNVSNTSSVSISQATLSSELSGSVGKLITKDEDAQEEDWMHELSEQKTVKDEESRQLMKNMAKDKAAPGELGVPVPGLHSDALKRFVQ